MDYISLNALLNQYTADGDLQLEADNAAVDAYYAEHIEPTTKDFDSTEAKVQWLVDNGYYDLKPTGYSVQDIAYLFDYAEGLDHRFQSFLGALKFYTSYALRTNDQSQYLESFTDRAALCAAVLCPGDRERAAELAAEIVAGRLQPATPTFLSAGRAQTGSGVSCFLLLALDNMESINYVISSSMQLSKRGGGVGICLTNLRGMNAPIKNQAGRASGLVPVMKILEDVFSYANQLGQRQGAGAVYVHACHPDIMRVLDTKRENADEKVRIKTLSLGIVVPDVAFELAKANEDLALFSPYDIERVEGKPMTEFSVTENYSKWLADDRITKSYISARKLFQTIAELQFESGYPYLLFEDVVNQWNFIDGRVSHSNLCSEITQISTGNTFKEDGTVDVEGRDISCNLASMNVARAMEIPLEHTVALAVRALSQVSDMTSIKVVPSVRNGNERSRAIGLGQMNLHGYLGSQEIMYGSEEALDFVNVYFATVRFHALKESCRLAQERSPFFEFEKSGYADGSALEHYTSGKWETFPHTARGAELFADQWFPTQEDWVLLDKEIQEHGLYNAYLLAVAPTGSISYINHATSSIHPIVSPVEVRKEGKLGRVYYAAYGMTADNMEYYRTAYALGYQPIIDTYAVAQKHVDQAQSLTLFFPVEGTTTRDLNRAYTYAWSRGRVPSPNGGLAIDDPALSWKNGYIKSLYYTRVSQAALTGTEVEGCVSCAI